MPSEHPRWITRFYTLLIRDVLTIVMTSVTIYQLIYISKEIQTKTRIIKQKRYSYQRINALAITIINQNCELNDYFFLFVYTSKLYAITIVKTLISQIVYSHDINNRNKSQNIPIDNFYCTKQEMSINTVLLSDLWNACCLSSTMGYSTVSYSSEIYWNSEFPNSNQNARFLRTRKLLSKK